MRVRDKHRDREDRVEEGAGRNSRQFLTTTTTVTHRQNVPVSTSCPRDDGASSLGSLKYYSLFRHLLPTLMQRPYFSEIKLMTFMLRSTSFCNRKSMKQISQWI